MDYIKVYKDISSRTMTKQNAMQRLCLLYTSDAADD